ncbi:hypothetical protein [Phycicoccus sonneratiae]|uniref:Uncharacterized protein n=1 Tax=Phycicoccus sonneratiae TaxID=2807628 RepID=A0ABS2CNS5_9MICO|nr:hypothetical protein [Phycicoccus sonneraticus]MBM6400811.1 hypothetical protein [Phycicoccus sonneraticus]
MIHLDSYAGQNWTIVPVTTPPRLPVTGPTAPSGPVANLPDIDITPATDVGVPYPSNQLWALTLTGVVFCDVQGTSESAWRYETVSFTPDYTPALERAAAWMGAATGGRTWLFELEQWAPHVTTATNFNRNVANNSGHGVDAWRPAPFRTETDAFGVERSHLFDGVLADVVVRDTDAIIHRLAYHVTLVGRLALWTPPPIP